MEVLADSIVLPELAKANKLFRRKDYFQSLEAYCECLKLLYREQQLRQAPTLDQLEMVLYSLRGMNYSAIREFGKAENDFDYVLKHCNFDSATLMRRASLFLKTKQFKKAIEDIGRLVELEPDSIRVAALMLQAKDRLSKVPDGEQREQLTKNLDELASTNPEDLDEQEMLNFCNLRLIDRKSQTTKSRASTVAFKEDSEICYEASELQPSSRHARQSLADQPSAEAIKHILESQATEAQQLDSDTDKPLICVVSKPSKQPKKSILKCSIRVCSESLPDPEAKQFNSLAVRNIEGKPIRNSSGSRVTFRSSQAIDTRFLLVAPTTSAAKGVRKSCLKQSAFGLSFQHSKGLSNNQSVGGKGRTSRSQSFLRLKIDKVDGKRLVGQETTAMAAELRQNPSDQRSQNSFDSGDEHNIFGYSQSADLGDKLKQTLGIDSAREKDKGNQHDKPSAATVGKKSILKRCSSLVQPPTNYSTKPKKSVLFKT